MAKIHYGVNIEKIREPKNGQNSIWGKTGSLNMPCFFSSSFFSFFAESWPPLSLRRKVSRCVWIWQSGQLITEGKVHTGMMGTAGGVAAPLPRVAVVHAACRECARRWVCGAHENSAVVNTVQVGMAWIFKKTLQWTRHREVDLVA